LLGGYNEDISDLKRAARSLGDSITQLREDHIPNVSLRYVSELDRSAFVVKTIRGVAYDIRVDSNELQGFQLIASPITSLKENSSATPIGFKMTSRNGERDFVHASDYTAANFIDAIHAKVGSSFSLTLTIKWTDANAIRDQVDIYEATFQKDAEPRYALAFKQRLQPVIRLA